MSIQSSCSKILFALKHHLGKGLSFVFGQCSDSGKGILHRVNLLWFLLLLSFPVFFSWAISCPMSCLSTFEAFCFINVCLSLNVNASTSIVLGSFFSAGLHQLLFVILLLFFLISPKMAVASRQLVSNWIAFSNQSSIVRGITLPYMILWARERLRAFLNSPMRWMLSNMVLVINPACPMSCLNSVTTCSAVFFPCFKLSNLHSASWTWSADQNALRTSAKRCQKSGTPAFLSLDLQYLQGIVLASLWPLSRSCMTRQSLS